MAYQIPLFNLNFDEIEAQAAYDTIKSGWISTGPKNAELEQLFTDMWNVKYAVSMSNCTDSLQKEYMPLYQIRVEHPYQRFSDDAFPPFGFRNSDILDNITRGQIFSKYDNRKIDIALTTANGERSLCGIEVKAINQPFNKIKSDIDRLSYAMNRKDEVDESSLQGCFVTFLIRADNRFEYVISADVQKSKEKYRTKMEKMLIAPMQSKYRDLTYVADCFDVDITTAEEEYRRVYDEGEDFSHRTRSVFGYIIMITRK